MQVIVINTTFKQFVNKSAFEQAFLKGSNDRGQIFLPHGLKFRQNRYRTFVCWDACFLLPAASSQKHPNKHLALLILSGLYYTAQKLVRSSNQFSKAGNRSLELTVLIFIYCVYFLCPFFWKAKNAFKSFWRNGHHFLFLRTRMRTTRLTAYI